MSTTSGMPSVSAGKHRRVETLDLLRLVAALSVVMYHYSFRGAAADGYTHISLPALIPVTKYAYLGVELFFVISGFVIAYSADGRTAREFIVARASRIYPGFIVCMTLTFLITLELGAPRFETSLMQWLGNLLILSPALKQPFMDGAYWSIVYELTFYAWVLGLILLNIFSRRLTVVVAVWLTISVANELLFDSGLIRRLFITDDSGFFCAGLLLYSLFSGRRGKFTWPLLVLATVIAAGQAVHNADWSREHFGIVFSSPVIALTCVGIVALVGVCLLPKRIPLPATLIAALGGLTYPLYLLHQHIGFMAFNKLEGLVSPGLLVGAVIAGMLCLSFIVWRFAERPAQRLLKSLLPRLLVWPFSWSPRSFVMRSRGPAAVIGAKVGSASAPLAVFGPVVLARAPRP
jgi:peptidoglycan/LPS O-acetylase OafA/YrhL